MPETASLTKPLGSLGRLEEIAEHLAAIQGGAPSVAAKALVIFAGDHGVAARGVSAYPEGVDQRLYNQATIQGTMMMDNIDTADQ